MGSRETYLTLKNQVHSWLHGAGFKVRRGDDDLIDLTPVERYVASDKERGLILRLAIPQVPSISARVVRGATPKPYVPRIWWTLEVRGPNNRYTQQMAGEADNVQVVRNAIVNVTGAPLKKRTRQLPELQGYRNRHEDAWRWHPSQKNLRSKALVHVLNSVFVSGVVTLSDDLEVIESGEVPDTDVWFLLECDAGDGATILLLTDGDGWLPVDRRTRRVSTNMTPSRSVNLQRMSGIDAELIQAALTEFLGQVPNG